MNVSVFNQSHSFWVILFTSAMIFDCCYLLLKLKQWSPTHGPWTSTGPWVSWYQAVQKECVTLVISDLFTIFFWTMFCTQSCNTAKWTKNKRSVKEPVDTVHLCPLLQQYPFSFSPYELHGVKCVPHIIRQVRLFFFSPNERNFIQTFPHVPNCESK